MLFTSLYNVNQSLLVYFVSIRKQKSVALSVILLQFALVSAYLRCLMLTTFMNLTFFEPKIFPTLSTLTHGFVKHVKKGLSDDFSEKLAAHESPKNGQITK